MLVLVNLRILGRQINMDVNRVISYRHICNKIWNAVRFALPILAANNQYGPYNTALENLGDQMTLIDRWILSKLVSAIHVTLEIDRSDARDV